MDADPELSSQCQLENVFVCKSKVCVVCAVKIIDEDVEGKVNEEFKRSSEEGLQSLIDSAPICPDVFLKGISVFCETLNIERKYTSFEEWALPGVGVDNFVRIVCCRECYKMFGNLVSLHELITATQASLEEDVRKLKVYIDQSQDTAKDVEYSINTCIQFRDHILKKTEFPQRDRYIPRSTSKSSLFQFGSRHKKKRIKVSRNRKSFQQQNLSPKDVPDAAVKLERLELGEEDQQTDFDQDSQIIESDNSDSDTSWNSVARSEDPMRIVSPLSIVENSQDNLYLPSQEHECEIAESGQNVNDEDSSCNERNFSQDLPQPGKRGRGRPRKIAPISVEPTVKRGRGRPRKLPVPDESVPVVKRKRGRPKKHNYSKADDEECDPDFNEVSVMQSKNVHRRRSSIQERRFKQKDSSITSNSVPKKRGRPFDHRKIISECSKRIAIFVINASQGVFMYLNVKFQKNQSTLLCKHPGCHHTVSIKGYFTDQTAFSSMRLHIRNVHRKKYKLVGEQDRKKCYFCSHCDMQLKSRPELLMHQKALHGDAFMPLTICEICGDIMQHQVIFKHLMTHKNDDEKALALADKQTPKQPTVRRRKVKTASRILTFPCNQCSKVFSTKSQQQIHKQSHIPIELRRQVICDICGDRVSSMNNLKLHKKAVHFRSEMPTAFECHICGKTFLQTEKIRFQTHLNGHTGERPFQCTQCGKGFLAKWNLTLHERSHKQTSVQCEFCPNWYKSEKYLKRHQAVHHPNLALKESKCSTRRYRPPRREEFIGPKLKYPCEPCHRVFLYKSMLVKHLKEKHKLFLEKSEDYPNQVTLEGDDMKMIAESSKLSTSSVWLSTG